jgi:hypothetical protein
MFALCRSRTYYRSNRTDVLRDWTSDQKSTRANWGGALSVQRNALEHVGSWPRASYCLGDKFADDRAAWGKRASESIDRCLGATFVMVARAEVEDAAKAAGGVLATRSRVYVDTGRRRLLRVPESFAVRAAEPGSLGRQDNLIPAVSTSMLAAALRVGCFAYQADSIKASGIGPPFSNVWKLNEGAIRLMSSSELRSRLRNEQ